MIRVTCPQRYTIATRRWPRIYILGFTPSSSFFPQLSLVCQIQPSTFAIYFANSSVAFWLRSSVVSVLFSLISEIPLRWILMIILIFASRSRASGLAHTRLHCVTGLTLPPVDANTPFHHGTQLV